MKRVVGNRRLRIAAIATMSVLVIAGLGAGIYSLARQGTTSNGIVPVGVVSGTPERGTETSGGGLFPDGSMGYREGSGAAVAMTAERLVVTIRADSTGGIIGAGQMSKCKLRGDFDVQVGYEALDWPPANGVKIGIRAGDVGSGERVSFGDPRYDFVGSPREVYLTHFIDGIQGITETQDTMGILRLTREGATLSGYVWRGGTWQLVHSNPAQSSADVPVTIWAWSEESVFGGVKCESHSTPL